MVVKVFTPISKDDIIKAIKNYLYIPVSIIKNFGNGYCEKLANTFNDCVKENKFPNLMI